MFPHLNIHYEIAPTLGLAISHKNSVTLVTLRKEQKLTRGFGVDVVIGVQAH